MSWEEENDEVETSLFFIPILVNIFGGFIDSVGWCMQKHAHMKRISNVDTQDQSFVKDSGWWCGYIVHALGDGIQKLSYAFGPASLLLPLDTLQIAFTTALAAKYLNESVSTKEIIGITIIVVAAAVSTVFGPRSQGGFHTIEDIEARYEQTAFLIVAGILSGFALLDWVGLRAHFFKKYRTDEFCMLSYINISAFFGAWNVLLVKCVLEVVSSSFISLETAKMNWTHWLTYINIIALITSSVSIEYWRQKALTLYHTGYVVAIYHVLQIIGGIILSSMFFEEFYGMKAYELLLFFVGIFLSFIGVGIVAYEKDPNAEDNKDDAIPMEKIKSGDVTVDESSSDDDDDKNKQSTNLIQNTNDRNDKEHGNGVVVDDEETFTENHQQQTPNIGDGEAKKLLS